MDCDSGLLQFRIDNPIFTKAPQLAAAYARGEKTNATAADLAAKEAVKSQIYGPNSVNDGSFVAADINRITSNFINGPAIETDGVDIFVKYESDYANGMISTGVEAAYVIDYSLPPTT